MALQKTLLTNEGIEVKDAYIKILNISGDKSSVSFNLGAFLNKECSTNTQPFKIFYNSISPNIDENIWIQVYEFFKITDDGNNSIDV